MTQSFPTESLSGTLDQWSSPVDALEMVGATFLDPVNVWLSFSVAGYGLLLWLKREGGGNVNPCLLFMLRLTQILGLGNWGMA